MEINTKNYEYLKNQVKFLGFGENLDDVLKEKLNSGDEAFTIPHQTRFGQDEVSSILHFSKSRESDRYFLNSFDLTLKQPGKESVLTQSYYIGKENTYTLKERYNMLDSRAVFKELNKLEETGEGEGKRLVVSDQTYECWKELDFDHTDKYGNFLPKTMFWNHMKVLEKYPVKELETPYDKTRLVASLEKGNLTQMTLIKDGEEIKGTMAANPRQDRFDFYDRNNQRLEVKKTEKQRQRQERGVQLAPPGNHIAGRENNRPVQTQRDAAIQLQKGETQDASARKENIESEKVNRSKRKRIRVSK